MLNVGRLTSRLRPADLKGLDLEDRRPLPVEVTTPRDPWISRGVAAPIVVLGLLGRASLYRLEP